MIGERMGTAGEAEGEEESGAPGGREAIERSDGMVVREPVDEDEYKLYCGGGSELSLARKLGGAPSVKLSMRSRERLRLRATVGSASQGTASGSVV